MQQLHLKKLYMATSIRLISLGLVVGASGLITGCVAVALAPLIPAVGGVVSGSNEVVVDPATITPEIRAAFSSSKTITVLGSDATVIHMAQYLDEKNAYQVRTVDLSKGATPSQRREQMKKVCADRSAQSDIVISPSAAESDAGGGATAAAMFLGRVKVDLTTNVEVLKCVGGQSMRFKMAAKLDQGIYNMDRSKIDQVLGHESAKALMRLSGKLSDSPSPAPSSRP